MAAALFFITFLVYLFSLAPGLTFGDSGELAAAAFTMGTAHPPGYIGWVLPGRIFSVLPIGSVCFRLSLMSAFSAALANLFLYKSLRLMRAPKIWALLSTLLFAFSQPFFDSAVTTEVYALNIFWFALFLYLFLSSLKQGVSFKNTALLALVSGLASAGHHTSLALIPVWFVLLAAQVRKLINIRGFAGAAVESFKGIFLGALMFLAGLSLYALMPIASANKPLMNWGAPDTLSSWAHTVTRAQYKGFDKFERTLDTIVISFSNFIDQILTWQAWAFIVTAFLGLVIAGLINLKVLRERKSPGTQTQAADRHLDFYIGSSWIIIWYLAVFSVFLVLLLMPASALTMNKTLQFYIPFYMGLLLLPWLISGLVLRYDPDRFRPLESGVNKSESTSALSLINSMVFILCAVLTFHNSFETVSNSSRAEDFQAKRFVKDLKISVDIDSHANGLSKGISKSVSAANQIGSIIFLDHDDNYFPLIHEQICSNKYSDIIPICPQFLSLKWYFNELRNKYPDLKMTDFDTEIRDPKEIIIRRMNDIINRNSQYRIYFQVNDQPIAPEGYKLVPGGLVFKLVPENQRLSNINRILNFKFSSLLNYQAMDDSHSLKLARLHDPDTAAALRYYGLASVNMALFAIAEQEEYRAWEFLKTADPFMDFMKKKEQIQIEYLKGKALVLSGNIGEGKKRLKQARKMGRKLPEQLDRLLQEE
jgi:hypothetical protein